MLEVECGEGEATLFLAREFPQARVRGVDRSEAAVRRATARVGLDPEGRVAFKVGAPGSLPFPDAHFELLAAVDAAPTAKEAARVLAPGGLLLLAHTEGAGGPGGLRRRWRERALARAGFEPVEAAAAPGGSFAIARLLPTI